MGNKKVEEPPCGDSSVSTAGLRARQSVRRRYFCGVAAGVLAVEGFAAGFFMLCFLCFFTLGFAVVEGVVLDWLLVAGLAVDCAAKVRGMSARLNAVANIVFFISFLLAGYHARQFHVAAERLWKR